MIQYLSKNQDRKAVLCGGMEGAMKKKELSTDVLIIGGGTAGCFAAMTLGKEKNISVLLLKKPISGGAAVWRQVSMQLMLILRKAECLRIM